MSYVIITEDTIIKYYFSPALTELSAETKNPYLHITTLILSNVLIKLLLGANSIPFSKY